jgi:hypothetical protein
MAARATTAAATSWCARPAPTPSSSATRPDGITRISASTPSSPSRVSTRGASGPAEAAGAPARPASVRSAFDVPTARCQFSTRTSASAVSA